MGATAQSALAAAKALGDLGERAKAAGPDLVDALDHPASNVRFRAALALGEVRHVPAVPRLIGCLDGDSRLVRLSAARSLTALRQPEAKPALRAAILSDDRWLRLGAAEALAAIGDPIDLELIRAARECDRRAIIGGWRRHWKKLLASVESWPSRVIPEDLRSEAPSRQYLDSNVIDPGDAQALAPGQTGTGLSGVRRSVDRHRSGYRARRLRSSPNPACI
jgi:hypothetical protein